MMKSMKKSFAMFLAALCLLSAVLAVPVSASAEEISEDEPATADSPITKVLAQTSGSPVASMSASSISASTSTAGCYVAGWSWTDMSGQTIDTFTTDYAMLTIVLGAQPGSYFAGGLEVYLNNTAVDASVGGGGTSLTITRVYAPDVWAPTITKHPTSENIEEGELTSFVASATGVDKSVWTLIDGSGTKYSMDELQKTYPQMTYSESFGKVILRNIPKALDNSKIYCTFSGAGGSVETNAAYIYVKAAAPSPTPSPSPTPTPTPTPSPSATPGTGADADKETAAPADHEHVYGREWKQDENTHWHECSVCGERSEEAAHSMTWTETKKPTKKAPGEEEGECSVCDYKTTREVEYEKPASSGKWILYVGIGAVVLMVALMIVYAVRERRERRRRAAARARRRRERGYDDWE